MRTNLFLLIFLLSALGLTAQNSGCTITGVVREYDLNMHKQALDGVEVRISVGGTRSDITENGGHFTIENIPYCKPGTKIQTDKNSFLKPGYELFYPDALDFWRVPNSTASGSTEILMCKSSRINEVRQKLFKVVDQHHKKLYEQKKAELEQANLERRELEHRLVILESQLRDTAQMMKVVNQWLYLDRMKCDSVMNLAYSHFENGEYDRACEIMNSYEMKSADYYLKKLHEVRDEVKQAIEFVKRRLTMNFANGNDGNVIPLIERDCDFLIDIYTDQLEDAANDKEGMSGDTNTLKKNLAAAYAFKGDISILLSYGYGDKLPEIISNYLQAAELGNAHAQYKMGEIYENVLNYDVSIQSYGYFISQFNTSFMFNSDSARLWYEKAAEQGEPSAIQRMLWFYDFSAKDKNGNEIYYHIMPDETSVMAVKKSENDNSYYDYLNIVLPKKVTNNKVEYNVTAIREQTFMECGQLKSLFIPNSVVEIGSQAFAFCQNLEYIKCEVNGTFYTDKEEMMLMKRQEQGDELVVFAIARRDVHDVIIPDHVTKIGDGAFAYGKMLYVVIPNTVVTIGKDAFLGCMRLDSIVIPNSVTNIGASAFFACENMQSLTMSESLTTIEQESFAMCSELKSVSIPASVKIIKNDAFLQCFNLESVVIPNSVTTIGASAFYYCSSLQSVNIPNSVTSIGECAFQGCFIDNFRCETGGVYFTTKDGTMLLENMDQGCRLVAFASACGIRDVTIPNSVTSIGGYAFFECENLQSVKIPNSVTSIGESAFERCYSLQSVKIPNSVTSIGYRAFGDCENLQSVTIPNSVTSIGKSAFEGCFIDNFRCETGGVYFTTEDGTMLLENMDQGCRLVTFASACGIRDVTIPNSVTSIGDGAFYYCVNLQSVTIPNSVTSIEDGAFYRCENLQSVTIPNSVTTIGDYAFAMCDNLQSVTIPNSVTTIGDYAFAWCDNLQSVTIPNSVTTIKESAFDGCWNLQSVSIPNSVTSIGDRAFRGCGNLQSVTIPNSVTRIGDEAFFYCANLQSVTIPNSVTSIELAAFARCRNLQSVNIPNSVTSIGDRAFYRCENLQSVNIPNSVTSIGDHAFYDCESLRKFEVPNSVTEFKEYALDYHSLSVLIMESTDPQQCTLSTPFELGNVACMLVVPQNCVRSYRNAVNWSTFPIITDNRKWAENREKALSLLNQFNADSKDDPESLIGKSAEIVALDVSLALSCSEILSQNGLLDKAMQYYELGLDFYKKIVQEAPSVAYTLAAKLNSLAYNFASARHLDITMQIIDQAISLAPDEPSFCDSKGEFYLMQGENQKALEMWNKVLKLNPDFLKLYPSGTNLSNGLKQLGLIE